jgi:hypothetical protein
MKALCTISLLTVLGVPLFGAPSSPQADPGARVEIPQGTATLEGVPTARVNSGPTDTTRRALDPAEAARERLKVSVRDGKITWASRGNLLLQASTLGPYTYLRTSEPGSYIRFTRLDDKIAYIEHVDEGANSVTWWGELRIVVGNKQP